MNRSTPGPPTPGVHWDSHPSSQWCHPAISSSVVPFSSCPPIPPSIRVFPVSQLFTWGGQSTGVSALASFLPKKSQGWSPSEWTGWISRNKLSSHEKIWRNFKYLLLSKRRQSEKATFCMILTRWRSGKSKTLVTIKISVFQKLEGENMNRYMTK